MFLQNISPVINYTDPWKIPYEERIKSLARGQRRVAYFYENPDNSTFRYRVYNMIQSLQESRNGTSAAYFHNEDPDILNKVIDIADVLVVCRSKYSDKLNRVITSARSKGKPVFFDVDDLVFDPAYVHLVLDTLDQDLDHPSVWDHWFAYVGRIGATMKLCDRAIATNPYLAARLQPHFDKPVSVIPNFLNRQQMEISRKIFQCKKSKKFVRTNYIHLGYFSGTPSHNKDLEVVSDALALLMESDPRITLRVVGFIDLRGPLQRYSSRIERYPLQDR